MEIVKVEELMSKFDTITSLDMTKYRVQKKVCGFCEKNKINMTYKEYLLKGNICSECTSKINQFNFNMAERNIRQLENLIDEKREELDLLGEILDFSITEDERLSTVAKMKTAFNEIKEIEKQMVYGDSPKKDM